ncbi:hypothetical protein PIB30_081117 [Stylosanthes scabra]|uniref:Uncharacterized protein n=1 Tax=Stylosanthes scabra TaxID=79078 RepID=A0ABU6VQD2_9FABA|nr:hypothetical protein [Stylosanthes scabra]
MKEIAHAIVNTRPRVRQASELFDAIRSLSVQDHKLFEAVGWLAEHPTFINVFFGCPEELCLRWLYNKLAATISLKLELSSPILEAELVPGLGLGNGLRRLLEADKKVANMCDAALDNGNRVHLYLEHHVITDPIVIKQGVVSDDTHGADAKITEEDDEVMDQPEKDSNDVNIENQNDGVQNAGRNPSRPPTSGQRIIPLREENEAPSVVVPQPDIDGSDNESDEYQYQSEELRTPPASDFEEEPVAFMAKMPIITPQYG